MRLSGLVALALAVSFSVHAQDEDVAAHFAKFPSPDKRFAVRASEGDGGVNQIAVIEVAKDRVVADLTENVMLSEPETVKLVWARDSKSFAVNFRAGGRYETTSFHRWKDSAFAAMESPESALYDKVVEPARLRELKAEGKPADTYLRRIWDVWKTVQWIDANTAEVHGESTAAYDVNDEPVDLAVGVEATIVFDQKGRPEILKAKEVPAQD